MNRAPDRGVPADARWQDEPAQDIALDRQRHQPVTASHERHRARYRRHWRFEVNDEAEEWVISYMDMVTLIMCAFVVIAALLDLQTSHTPQPPAPGAFGSSGAAAAIAVPSALPPTPAPPGQGAGIVGAAAPEPEGVVAGSSDQGEGSTAAAMPSAAVDQATGVPPSANPAANAAPGASAAGQAPSEAPQSPASQADARLEEQWRAAVAAQGLESRVSISARGRVVTMQIQDEILFPTGEAELQPLGRDTIRRIAPLLGKAGGDIRVEGHTDNVPIANDRFASNWELSAARATSVVRALIDAGIAPARLRATGYADTRPEQSNETDSGRSHNRRVTLLVEQ